jgi:hypothetical protein
VSAQPPVSGQPQPQGPDPETIPCPRCAAPVGGDQDWCLECGAPARTRLAQTPNWRLPTVAIGAIVLLAGALLAFAFVKLTSDDGATPAAATATAPVVDTTPTTPIPPPAGTTLPGATTPVAPAPPAATAPAQTTTGPGTTTTAPPAAQIVPPAAQTVPPVTTTTKP